MNLFDVRKTLDSIHLSKRLKKYVVVKPFQGLVKTGLLKVNQSMRFQSHAWGNWQTGRVPVGVYIQYILYIYWEGGELSC